MTSNSTDPPSARSGRSAVSSADRPAGYSPRRSRRRSHRQADAQSRASAASAREGVSASAPSPGRWPGPALLAGGYAVADAEDVVPGVLTLSAPTSGRPPTPRPAPSWPATDPAQAVLADPSASAPMPDPTTLARQLAAIVHALGAGGGAEVLDVATGHVLYAHGASTPRTPASTTKLLTAAALLSALEPDATLPTTVVRGGDKPTVPRSSWSAAATSSTRSGRVPTPRSSAERASVIWPRLRQKRCRTTGSARCPSASTTRCSAGRR